MLRTGRPQFEQWLGMRSVLFSAQNVSSLVITVLSSSGVSVPSARPGLWSRR